MNNLAWEYSRGYSAGFLNGFDKFKFMMMDKCKRVRESGESALTIREVEQMIAECNQKGQ